MPAMPPSALNRSDAADNVEPPQRSGTKPPSAVPATAQRPITERPITPLSAAGRVEMSVSFAAPGGYYFVWKLLTSIECAGLEIDSATFQWSR
jgi:hypothetical protein